MDAQTLAADVVTWGDLRTTSAETPQLETVAAAALAFVERLPVLADRADPLAEWPADVKLGVLMLTARMWRRRDTPNGIVSIGDDGSPAFVARYDPEVQRLLGLDRPAVG